MLHIGLVCIFVEETTLCVDVCVFVVFIGNLQITIFKPLCLRGSKGVGVTIESYGKLEISYINVDNF